MNLKKQKNRKEVNMSKKLVIAEKPSVAYDYAKVLNCNNKKDGYIEGDNYIVTWCLGHLFTLKEPGDYKDKYDKWKFQNLPIIPERFEIKLNQAGKKQFPIIKKLINRSDVTEIINGGDAGREGELIQRYVINYSRTDKPVKRLWVSSLTEEEIKRGFDNLQPQSEYNGLYEAAKTRAELDWLIGINYTRAYTTQNQGNNLIVVGRVQTAILNLIKTRDKKRDNFEPKPYKQVIATFKDYQGKYINQQGNTKVFDFGLVKEIKSNCKNKTGKIVEVDRKKKKKYAPKLFNLTGLQKRMNKKYGFSAQRTLDIAQKLYEKYKILSYPRTDSKYLETAHKKELPQILRKISFSKYKSYTDQLNLNNLSFSKRFINDKKVGDHHAIIPTNNSKMQSIYEDKLTNDGKKLFDEVVLRLIVQFFDSYRYSSTKVITEIAGKYTFKSKGISVIDKGWKEIYPDKREKNALPQLKEGEKKDVTQIEVENKKTKPPKAYNESSLLAKLEKYGIGTEATRAGIIEKLLSRKYITRQGKKLVSTISGRKVIDTIITDSLKSPELTGKLEEKLNKIKEGKFRREEVLSEEIKMLKEEINKLKDKNIAVDKERKKSICQCPKCETGVIVKRKGFYGCTNWNEEGIECDFTINKIAKKMLTKNQVKRLCTKEKTKKLRGFKSKDGDKFSAKLELNDNYDIEFNFKKEKLGTCPQCGEGEIIEGKKGYGCSRWKEGCEFVIWKRIAGKRISKNQAKKLIKKGKTRKLKGFKSKKGNKFSAKLNLNDDYEVEFIFEDNNDINCPMCNNGAMIDRGQFYGCSNYPDCKFTVSKEICSKKINEDILKNLCNNGETNKLKGFTSKKGNDFEAKLVLEKRDIEFEF